MYADGSARTCFKDINITLPTDLIPYWVSNTFSTGSYFNKLGKIVDTVQVESNGQKTVVNAVLKKGVDYVLEASGDYIYCRSLCIADAKCYSKPVPGSVWVGSDSKDHPKQSNLLQLWLNNATLNWREECNEEHVYTAVVTGEGGSSGVEVGLHIVDTDYSDNQGSLNVVVCEKR